MVLKETNRFRGPAPLLFDRTAIDDFHIGDIPVKKGTLLGIVSLCNFFNSDYFDKPYEFLPERWEDPRYKSQEMQIITEMAFSGGPRTCIGKQLAHL